MKHLFILNPKSFWHKWKQEAVLARIHDFFKIMGTDNYTVHISRFPRDAMGFIHRFMKELPAETPLRVYAIGGDGILFDCLNGIVGFPNVELAAIPYGYSNNFIRGFDWKNRSLFRDISRQFTSPAIPMDIIHCGNSYALSFCALGIEAQSVFNIMRLRNNMREGEKFMQWLGRRLYSAIYYVGAVSACFDKEVYRRHYEIDIDGEDLSGNYRSILMANGPYYGGNIHPVSAAMPNDGMMDIVLARSGNPIRAAALIPAYIMGLQHKFPGDFILKRGRKIRIGSGEPIMAASDGIIFYGKDFTVELMPGALRFVDVTGQGYRGVADA
jgi:diacylglycerol kinase family enzyme